MFRAFLFDSTKIRDIFSEISNVVEEGDFVISPDKIKLKAMDSSRTTMIDLELLSSFFDKFDCNKTTRIRLSIKQILNLFENLAANESIDFRFLENESMLIITLQGDYQRVFKVHTLTPGFEAEIEPKTSDEVKLTVLSNSLKKVILDAKKMGEQIQIKATKEAIAFQTFSDLGNVTSTFSLGETPITELIVNQECEATYNLEVLGTIIKDAPLISETLRMEYSKDQPLFLDLLITNGKLHFYLAPLIEQ